MNYINELKNLGVGAVIMIAFIGYVYAYIVNPRMTFAGTLLVLVGAVLLFGAWMLGAAIREG